MSDDPTQQPPSPPPEGDRETDTRELVHHVVGGIRQVYQHASHLGDLSPVDDIIEDESEIIAKSVRLTVESQLDRWSQHPPYCRGFHAKPHAVVQATFTVHDDIPEALRHGVLATPGASFEAWIRYSNGNGLVLPDLDQDTRGMALKLMGVDGERNVMPGTDIVAPGHTQDFVMMAGGSTFFVADIEAYVEFQEAKSAGSYYFDRHADDKFQRVRAFLNAFQNATSTPQTPVDTQYWSLAPYKLGPHEIKFSVWTETMPELPPYNEDDPDFLRKGFEEQLRRGGVELVFGVQLRSDPDTMPIEDWTVEWSDQKSPYIPVASLHIPAQSFTDRERLEFGDALSFNPYHGLPAHQPLGQLGQLRGAVYQASSRLRHARNDQVEAEPTAFGCPLSGAVPGWHHRPPDGD